ncbi:MAG: hypothetical protein ACKVOP_06000 [Sphingomonadaceae bacterium]
MPTELTFQRLLHASLRLSVALACALLLMFAPAQAQTCAGATTAGTAPVGWESYCWLDMTSYNDATARTAGGQTLAFTLTDGSVFSMNVRTTSTAATGVAAVAAPSWSGAAVGNTAFLGIPGRPILYGANAGSTVTLTFSAMTITPPSGATSGNFMFIVADAESSNGGESLRYTTNGGNWILLDQVDPISGSTYPTFTNSGAVVDVTGVGGTVGAQIFGSTTPGTVTTQIVNGGLQGVMFAVRFASIRLNKTIVSGRVAAADQFTYAIRNNTSGTAIATRTTSGAGNSGFTPAVASLASGIPIRLTETMAAGSASPLTAYSPRLTCTNSNTGSTTPLPNNVATSDYVFGALVYGDNVTCAFTNTPFARVRLTKALGGTRAFPADQFTMNVTTGATTVATITTTGTGATVTNASTPVTQVTAGTPYIFSEAAAGTTVLNYYTATMACTNSFAGSPTALPNSVGGSVTPVLGDNISCTITNTPRPPRAELTMTKVSSVISDPVNGTANPKLIPGAVVEYTILVTNVGNGPVDANTVVVTDPLPAVAGTTRLASYVLGTAVTFTNGPIASGLTYNYATNVGWSKTTGGGAPFTAALTPDANGFDGAVTGIRIAPGGTMAAATPSGQPSFTLRFRAEIK